MNERNRRAMILALVALGTPVAWAVLPERGPQNVPVRSSHDFDELNRLTKVTRDSGHSVSYVFDPAGNITAVAATGRSSATLRGVLGERGNDDQNSHDDFDFVGVAGEPITVRVEAVPREAGVGKFAEIQLRNKRISAALPTELTMVLPESGEFEVRVKDHADPGRSRPHGYSGPYTITLEAAAATCASFVAESNPDQQGHGPR